MKRSGVLHVLGKTQRRLIEAGDERIAAVVGVDESVVEGPHRVRILNVGQVARRGLRVGETRSAVGIGSRETGVGGPVQVRRRAVIPVLAVAAGESKLVGEAMVALDIELFDTALAYGLLKPIVDVGDWIRILVRLRVELHGLHRHRIHMDMGIMLPGKGLRFVTPFASL